MQVSRITRLAALGLPLTFVACTPKTGPAPVAPSVGSRAGPFVGPPGPPPTAPPGQPFAPAFAEEGLATWYGKKFAGRMTSNGERFDPRAMTAAHRRLPFGTWVEVRRLDSGQAVRVRITDRGPWGDDRRIIDLSEAAASAIDAIAAGVVPVRLTVVAAPP